MAEKLYIVKQASSKGDLLIADSSDKQRYNFNNGMNPAMPDITPVEEMERGVDYNIPRALIDVVLQSKDSLNENLLSLAATIIQGVALVAGQSVINESKFVVAIRDEIQKFGISQTLEELVEMFNETRRDVDGALGREDGGE